jgi:DNA polymerase III subunit alpha
MHYTGDPLNAEDLLWEWVRFGWRYRRIGARTRAEQDWYVERIKYEMGLMLEKELADFMLFTSDAIRWAKDNGIPIGPGRGSTAASVVAYLLRITEIDPYRYQGMLFERFLDVSRADPPDIDVDCSDERRDDVRAYLASKYGEECVGQIGNFVRYRAKNSLVDIARVYSIPIGAKETVANLIIERSGGDSRFDSSLEDTVNMFPAAAEIFERFPDLWKATQLEGNMRGMSVHAAGIIVANSPLTDICAVYERDGRRVLSIDKYDVEYIDALKLDFLGLSTMGMIARCLAMTGLTLEDLYAIPDTDASAIRIFRDGDVTGVFQFEGRATRLVNRDVHPDHFIHIADINALSRPGPLFSGTTAEYVDVRHGRRKAEHLHEMVDEVTKDTYGQIIYQEQILRILKDMGGFDWFSVGQIRRIISKKLGEAAFQMNQDQFTQGALDLHGVPHETAMKIWKRLVTSGTYSFNIAHAISYSMIAFWTAWLKSHYPLEFYAASLAKAAGDDEQSYKLMQDARRHDIVISPPRLRISRATWVAHHDLADGQRELVAGWQQIPGIGEITASRIEEYCGEFYYPGSWQSLEAIKGIGPKTVDKMEMFATAHDPFGLDRTAHRMERGLAFIAATPGVPNPTHDGTELAAIQIRQEYGANAKKNYGKGPRVIYAGIVKTVNYQDIIENRRSRTGEEVEDIRASLHRPDLLEYCSIRCYDTTEEEVYIRVNRYTFPRLKRLIAKIAVGTDILVCVGNRIAGFGTPVMADKLFVIDPD